MAEDSPNNPATIADNVGDNVGDIAGMGSDLFGSFAEATCATLVLIASNKDLVSYQSTIYYPLIVQAVGIIACIVSSIIGIYYYKIDYSKKVAMSLNI